MPTPTNPTPEHSTPRTLGPHEVEFYSYGPTTHGLGRILSVTPDLELDDLPDQLDDRAASRIGKSYTLIDAALMQDAADTIRHLATLLDGVLADDPQAIRDAAAWLTVNRPEVSS